MIAYRKLAAHMWQWLAVLFLVCFLGCSNGASLNPVQGTVLYQDKPLKGVLVTFHPKSGEDLTVVQPLGLTGEDGTFKLTTGENDGAIVGEYIVTFICSEPVPLPPGKSMAMAMGQEFADRFKGTYAEKSASKFQIEIKAGPNQLEPFRLK